MTYLVIGGIIYSIWHFGNDVIFKNKSTLLVTNYNDEDPLRINWTDENFVFTIGLQNPDYSNYINETIYTLEVIQYVVTKDILGKTNHEQIILPVVRCSLTNITLLPAYFN